MKRLSWTAAENRRLRAKYPHVQTAKLLPLFPGRTLTMFYQHARVLGLSKTPKYLSSPEAGRLRPDTGSAHRFPKGHKTWNAGLKGWQAGGRSRETQFKKGTIPPNRQEIGALRVNTYGVLDIKTGDGLRSWESMARFVWRTERGPIPHGGVIRPINGDPHDTRIGNLRFGTKASVMLENTIHRLPKELARLIQLRGALNRQINKGTAA